MSAIRAGDVIPTSATRRFGFNRVTETVQILGSERNSLVPVKVVNRASSCITLIRIEQLDQYLASPLVKSKGINETTRMTISEENICGLWEHMKNLAELPSKNPDWSWTGVKKFYVEFNELGYIKAFNRPNELPEDCPYAELAIQEDGTLSLISEGNMPVDFYEQLKELNYLLANLN